MEPLRLEELSKGLKSNSSAPDTCWLYPTSNRLVILVQGWGDLSVCVRTCSSRLWDSSPWSGHVLPASVWVEVSVSAVSSAAWLPSSPPQFSPSSCPEQFCPCTCHRERCTDMELLDLWQQQSRFSVVVLCFLIVSFWKRAGKRILFGC